MKIHPLNCLVAVMFGALLTYGIVSIGSSAIKGTIGIGAFVFFASSLAIAAGVSFERSRTGTNVRIVSLVFFVAALLANLFFAVVAGSQTGYIVTCGLLFLLYVLIASAVFSAEH
jgi:hypothetical protein